MNDKYVAARMPQATKDLWIKALRSGKYTQAKEYLYNPYQKGYCCLGVLQCELTGGKIEHEHEIGVLLSPEEYDPAVSDLDDVPFAGVPSPAWCQSNGIEDPHNIGGGFNPTLEVEKLNAHIKASDLNDEYDYTFEQIADLIEEQVEGY